MSTYMNRCEYFSPDPFKAKIVKFVDVAQNFAKLDRQEF